MAVPSVETIKANSKAFIYKLEVMEYAMENATKGFLQDDKGSIFCLETRDADATRVLLARVLRTLSKESVLKQNLAEIFTDFSDFASMSHQQNNDWTKNFPNLLVCKVDRDGQLDEHFNILESWVNNVKAESKKIIFIVKNSKNLESIMMKIGMANFIKLKFTELWEQNEISMKSNPNICRNVNENQVRMNVQDLDNNEPATALDEDMKVNLDKRSSKKRSINGETKIHDADPSRAREINTRDFSGDTQLHVAAWSGKRELVKHLLARGAKMDIKDYYYGQTALHFAAERGHFEIAKILLKHGANVNATDKNIKTPLHASCKHPNANIAWMILELLLKFNAEIDKKCADGETSLHVASRHGHIEVINSLLQNGANIDAQDNAGKSPLYVATESNNPEVVSYLLQKGANIHIKYTLLNKTPLDVARDRNDTYITEIIEKHASLMKKPR
ncbi:unnamed protein product [Ceutorhynchus assimilis]|uniref:Uncharacterized protein n=1 Tax=Ceutorhynchus assimilis TaxID=467358 RepID=A0A9N9ML00_9CUCU|nr:unnamed protein product [Ceutorhynchus assimilis]